MSKKFDIQNPKAGENSEKELLANIADLETRVRELETDVGVFPNEDEDGYIGDVKTNIDRLREQVGNFPSFENTYDLKIGGSLAVSRYGHTSHRVGDNIYIIGGYDNGMNNSKSVEVYNTQTHISTRQDDVLQVPRNHHSSTLVREENKIYIIGGEDVTPEESSRSIEVLDISNPKKLTSELQGDVLNFPRSYHTSELVGTKIHIIGGQDAVEGSEESSKSIEVLDISDSQSFSSTLGENDLFRTRVSHTSHLVGGMIYIIGGEDIESGSGLSSRSIEIYDPATGNLEDIENNIFKNFRYGHSSILIEDETNGDKIYVMGGEESQKSVEVYDVEEGQVIKMGTIRENRDHYSSVLDGNNEIYIIGGGDSNATRKSVEILAPEEPSFFKWQILE